MPDRAPTRGARKRRRTWLLLALVLTTGFALRCWYLSRDLSYKRFWDERYSFENVRGILETGSFKPAKSYYPSPLVSWPQAGLVAASEAVHQATGWEFFHAYKNRKFKPAAFLWVRLLSAVYGVAGLLMTFLVGRQLFDDEAALLGTTLLTFMPWHLHASAKFKPDALLVFAILLAFWLSVRAVRGERLRPYIWAGLAISLALSSKLTGGLVAVPLVVATAMTVKDDLRRWWWLCVAGVTSLVAFFATNPYGYAYIHFVQSLQVDYAMRADMVGMTRASMPAELVSYITGPYVHGRWIGPLAFVGFAVLALSLLKVERRTRVERAMFLVFPIVYAAAYLSATPYFKGNNLLPILPFSSLLVAWVVVGVWRWVWIRLPDRSLRFATVAGVAALLALGVSPGLVYVYRALTPTSWDVAIWHLERGAKGRWGRSIYAETAHQPEPRWEGNHDYGAGRSIRYVLDRLDEVTPERLDRSDGEIFHASRLEGDGSEFYRERIAAAEGREVVIEPRWFDTRGPALVAIPRSRRLKRISRALPPSSCGESCATLTWSQEKPPQRGLLSVVVSLPVETPIEALSLDVEGRRYELERLEDGRRRAYFASPRFRWHGQTMTVTDPSGELDELLPELQGSAFSWSRLKRRPVKTGATSG
jgi:4-amino-4-deoxy-L-arabinose transferase-like glycosyltransferase